MSCTHQPSEAGPVVPDEKLEGKFPVAFVESWVKDVEGEAVGFEFVEDRVCEYATEEDWDSLFGNRWVQALAGCSQFLASNPDQICHTLAKARGIRSQSEQGLVC